MKILIIRLIETLLYPPMGPFLVMTAGTLMLRFRKRLGQWFLIIGLAFLYLGSIPLTTQILARIVQSEPALTPAEIKASGAQAIAVIGGGRYYQAPEYARDTSAGSEMMRLRYAAYLHRKTSLPIAVIDGDPFTDPKENLRIMQHVLEDEFQVPVRWSDERSQTTQENARYAKELLAPDDINRIALVTHAWHMPRAKWAFERQGLQVTAAPTAFIQMGPHETGIGRLVPKASALSNNNRIWHELIGSLWYRFRY